MVGTANHKPSVEVRLCLLGVAARERLNQACDVSQDGSIRWVLDPPKGCSRRAHTVQYRELFEPSIFTCQGGSANVEVGRTSVMQQSYTPIAQVRVDFVRRESIGLPDDDSRVAERQIDVSSVESTYSTWGGKQGETSRVNTALRWYPTILPQTVEHIEPRRGLVESRLEATSYTRGSLHNM